MNIQETIAQWKQDPEFIKNVGMVLSHYGMVRGTSRVGAKPVAVIKVTPNHERIEALRLEYEQRPGIFRIAAEAHGGTLTPGDDLLYIIVAGDIRENVKSVLAELLDRIKSEAVTKQEILAAV